MAFVKDFLGGFFGTDFVKDSKHASRTFVSDTHALAPRNKFLFHAFLEINTMQIPSLRTEYPSSDLATIGLLVKTVTLPSFNISTEKLRQYNRSRVVQTKVEYQPMTITFHDDGSDYSRKLWHHYYSYYYGDTAVSQSIKGSRDIYNAQQLEGKWGYQGEPLEGSVGIQAGSKPPFFRSIMVFGMNRKRWVSYEMVNPLITSWQHDTYNYSEGGGIMENAATIEYEYVKYYEGDGMPPGFGDPARYDLEPSPLGRGGATSSILGPGGLVDAAGQFSRDLASGNILGAIRTAGTVYNQQRDMDIGAAVREETRAVVRDAARSAPGVFTSKPHPQGVLIPVTKK